MKSQGPNQIRADFPLLSFLGQIIYPRQYEGEPHHLLLLRFYTDDVLYFPPVEDDNI